MDGTTKKISEYVRQKGFNLSEISRKTGVAYMALYDSLMNEKRDRDLRVDEFLNAEKHELILNNVLKQLVRIMIDIVCRIKENGFLPHLQAGRSHACSRPWNRQF